MRRFFSSTRPPQSTSPLPHPHLQPKYTVPPLPHPCPHEYIEVLVTRDGLLLRPHVGLRDRGRGASDSEGSGVVRIGWGREGKVELVLGGGEGEDWESSVVVYGIVGILQLTFGASTSLSHTQSLTPLQKPHISS
jgi:hypothetical protein